jgi:PTH2 family peptidyl-tRNA hydrolase
VSEPKQVIVIRKDLNMRKGKMVAQGAHAAMAFLTETLRNEGADGRFSVAETLWLSGRFTKICVSVDSEEQLLAVHAAAETAGVRSILIRDAGLTEFAGVPTLTCLALGPDYPERLDPISGDLKLL